MSHETIHTTNANKKISTSFYSSFWFVVLLAGLFVAAVNFVRVMSHDDGGHGSGHSTEAHHNPAGHSGGH